MATADQALSQYFPVRPPSEERSPDMRGDPSPHVLRTAEPEAQKKSTVNSSRSEAMQRVLNVAYLTSCRELSSSESVGKEVTDPISGSRYGRRKALVEELVEAISKGDDPVFRRTNLSTIIVDDDPEEIYEASRDHPLWPHDLEVPTTPTHLGAPRRTIASITHLVPSTRVRGMKREAGEAREHFLLRKSEVKRAYEEGVLKVLRSAEADIILSDSYMIIFAETLLKEYGGRIINIHPGILDPSHPARTLGATPTRDVYTRAVHGYVIIDDKNVVKPPAGPVETVQYEGRSRTAVRVPRIAEAGVSVHFVTETIDSGPVIACESYGFDPQSVTPEWIRTRNYALKLHVLRRALAYLQARLHDLPTSVAHLHTHALTALRDEVPESPL